MFQTKRREVSDKSGLPKTLRAYETSKNDIKFFKNPASYVPSLLYLLIPFSRKYNREKIPLRTSKVHGPDLVRRDTLKIPILSLFMWYKKF